MEIRSDGRKIAERSSLFRAGGNFRHGDIFEDRPQRVHQVQIVSARRVLVRANQHLFRAAAARDQADAHFNESDICFRRGMNPRGVQIDFASAAQRHSLRRRHHGRGAYLIAMFAR